MGGHNPPRELVEDLAFADQLKRIKLDVRRFDAIWESIVIDLARDPEGNPIVHKESGTRMIKTDAWGDDAPALRVFYKVELERICLRWIEFNETHPE